MDDMHAYTAMIRKSWAAILAAALLACGVAVGVTLLLPKTYESEARVLVSQADSGVSVFGTNPPELAAQKDNAVQTQAELLRSPSLFQAVITRLGLRDTPTSLASRVTIAPVDQTSVISIKARAGDRQTPALIANALADEYLSRYREIRQQAVKAAADVVAAEVTTAQSQLQELDAAAQKGVLTASQATDRQIASDKLSSLSDKLEQLRVSAQVEQAGGTVTDRATASANPIGPTPVQSAAYGFAAGLLLSGALVVYRGSRAATSGAAEDAAAAPVAAAEEDPAARDLAEIRSLPEAAEVAAARSAASGGDDRRKGAGGMPASGDRRGKGHDRRRGGVDRRVARDMESVAKNLRPQDVEEIEAFWSALGVPPGDDPKGGSRSGSEG